VGVLAGLAACAPADRGDEAGEADAIPYVPPPGDAWETVDPAEAGFDPEALDAAIAWVLEHETAMPGDPGQYLRDRFEGQRFQEIVGPTKKRGGVNGTLLRGGRIVAEWGDTRRPDMTFSVTKSYLSTVIGLAWDRGMIPDLDAPEGELVHDGGFDSPHNAAITWRNHLQQLSEWEGTLFGKPDQADRREGVDRELRAPGTFWEYNDVRVNRLALSALRIWGEPLPAVLKREIMDPIGASDTWEWNGYETSWVDVGGTRVQSVSGGGHWGGGLMISTRDHARFGLMMARGGLWGDRRILSEDWVAQSITPSIQPNYGFMWWLNTGRKQFPNAPESSFFALGAGSTSTIWIDPDHDLVMVSRWIDGPDVNELIGQVLAALGRAAEPVAEAAGFKVGFTASFEKIFLEPPIGFTGDFGDRAEVSLARGETEAVQLVLFPEEDVAGASIQVGGLVGPGGATIPREEIEVSVVGYVNLLEAKTEGGRTGWHPDPLLPNQPVDLAAGTPQPYLIAVRAEPGTPPGIYEGPITIESAAGASVERVFAATVWDVTLPSTPRFKTANLSTWRLPDTMWPRSLGFPEFDDETRMRHMLHVADLGFAYRLPPTVFLANGLTSFNGGGRGETDYGFPTHDLTGDGRRVFNAERTDRLLDYMLDRGANHFFLAVTSNVFRPPGNARARQDRLVAYLRDYRTHLRRRGLLDMAYVYNIDEPWGVAVEHAKQTYDLIRDRVGTDLRVMQNTNQNNRRIVGELLGHFDVLDINLGFYDVMWIDGYRKADPEALDEVWWNLNIWPDTHPNLFLEYPLVDARIVGPMSYAYGIDGFEYWQLLWPPGIGNYHPIARDELRVRWDVDRHSLDGSLIYPGVGYEIYPSLRLASLRDGFEDLELLYLLEDVSPQDPLLDVPIVKGLSEYTGAPDELLDFRRRVAEAIAARSGAPGSTAAGPPTAGRLRGEGEHRQ